MVVVCFSIYLFSFLPVFYFILFFICCGSGWGGGGAGGGWREHKSTNICQLTFKIEKYHDHLTPWSDWTRSRELTLTQHAIKMCLCPLFWILHYFLHQHVQLYPPEFTLPTLPNRTAENN